MTYESRLCVWANRASTTPGSVHIFDYATTFAIAGYTTATDPAYTQGQYIAAMDARHDGREIALYYGINNSAGSLRLVNDKGVDVRTIALPAGPTGRDGVKYSPDGRYLAVTIPLSVGGFAVYDLLESAWVATPPLAGGNGAVVSWSPDGQFLAVGRQQGFYVYNTTTWDVVHSFVALVIATPTSVVWTADSAQAYFSFYVTTQPSQHMIFGKNVAGWTSITLPTAFSYNVLRCQCLAISTDGTTLFAFSGSEIRRLRLSDQASLADVGYPASKAPFAVDEQVVKVMFNNKVAIGLGGSLADRQFSIYNIDGPTPVAEEFLPNGGSYYGSPGFNRAPELVYQGLAISNVAGPAVTGADGNPIAGVPVVVMNRSTNTPDARSVVTDAAGRFLIPVYRDTPRAVWLKAPTDNFNSQIVDWVVPR